MYHSRARFGVKPGRGEDSNDRKSEKTGPQHQVWPPPSPSARRPIAHDSHADVSKDIVELGNGNQRCADTGGDAVEVSKKAEKQRIGGREHRHRPERPNAPSDHRAAAEDDVLVPWFLLNAHNGIDQRIAPCQVPRREVNRLWRLTPW